VLIRGAIQFARVVVAAWQLGEAEYQFDVIRRATDGLRHRDDARDCAPCVYTEPYRRRAHAARQNFLARRRELLRGLP
jgi:hypothetical protein